MDRETQKKYIIHIDADAFFASCEQSVDIHLKGKPVVVGAERGICTAFSYEAKALGVKRGMPIFEVKKKYPACIIFSGNYKLYSLISKRMFEIVRRYTEDVEEYSIDECFADITGLDFTYKKSYEEIAKEIKTTLDKELGITFSVGLASTKVLAKIGSKYNKPSGFTLIKNTNIHSILKNIYIGDVWGIGSKTTLYLEERNIKTALEFISKNEKWISENMAKPYQEIWYELQGRQIYSIQSGVKKIYNSISKTKTFTPPSRDKDFLFSQLSKNIENACIKARKYNLTTDKVSIFLKRQDFTYDTLEIDVPIRTNIPSKIVSDSLALFGKIYKRGVWYRATGIVLKNLGNSVTQNDLFEKCIQEDKLKSVFKSVDSLSERFGMECVTLGSSFVSLNNTIKKKDSDILLKQNKTSKKFTAVPIIGEVS